MVCPWTYQGRRILLWQTLRVRQLITYLPTLITNFSTGMEDTALMGGDMVCVTLSSALQIRSKGWRPGSGLKTGIRGRELHLMGLSAADIRNLERRRNNLAE